MSPTLRGIVMMVVAMAAFAVEDALIKLAAASMPPGQILAMLGFPGALIFAAWARAGGHAVMTRAALSRPMVLRNLFEVTGTLGFVTSLSLIPLSTASAILQATPLVVTAGAALFLGDPVGWRRWMAVGVGFAGVVLILRPGVEGFDVNALWAVLGVMGLAARDLVTRRLVATLPTPVVAAWAFAAVALLGCAMLVASGGAVLPGPRPMAFVLAALVVGIGAYWAIVEATRAGDVVAITPFRYTRLIFALAIGAVLFGERPDAAVLGGAALIIASGLYTFARERARARRTLASAPAAG